MSAEANADTVAIACRDRPGLFSRVAGTLALHGLDVLSARIWSSDDGIAAEYFEVQPLYGTSLQTWYGLNVAPSQVVAGPPSQYWFGQAPKSPRAMQSEIHVP